MDISLVELNTIKKHSRNARIHSEENIRAIADSLLNFGQRTPLVINNNDEILKGNGTYDAMILLGWPQCQVTICGELSPEEELAYLLADNKTSDLSEFDLEQVTGIFKELNETGTDLIKTGFREFESKPLLDTNWTSGENEPIPGPVPTNELRIKFAGSSAIHAREILDYAKTIFKNDTFDQDDSGLIMTILIYWREYIKIKFESDNKPLRRRSKPK